MSLLAAIGISGASCKTLAFLGREKTNNLPLWKGFNLLNKFNANNQSPFDEQDFEIMAEWGFNFVRLPLSQRYRGISNKFLSFNLINEAPSVSEEKYDRVARRLISAIRNEDPDRLSFVDGKMLELLKRS